jgi:putative transposase
VLFFIELDTRRVHFSGITTNPVGEWVTQQARNLSFVLAEQARPRKFLIRDETVGWGSRHPHVSYRG